MYIVRVYIYFNWIVFFIGGSEIEVYGKRWKWLRRRWLVIYLFNFIFELKGRWYGEF